MTSALDDTLARIKVLDQKIIEAIAKRNGTNGGKPMNTPANDQNDEAVDTIDGPFTLNADAIIERVNEATKETVYEVEKEGKVIFSAFSRPLAFAFLAGVHANPSNPRNASGEPKGSKANKGRDEKGDKPPTASVQSAIVAASNDKSSAATAPAPKRRVL